MIRRNRWLKPGLFVLFMLLMLSGSAAAAQFSATMLIKDGEKLLPAKIYVQDGKLRQEFNDEQGQTITIVRPDQKVYWIIIPRKQAYVELPLKGKLPGQFIQIPSDAMSRRLVGKEPVDGYEAEKYQLMVRAGNLPEIQTIWVATKLGTPVKMTAKGGKFSVEYQSIKEGPQPDRLFNLPPGYKKLKSAAGF